MLLRRARYKNQYKKKGYAYMIDRFLPGTLQILQYRKEQYEFGQGYPSLCEASFTLFSAVN